jgi:hypothetical protein
VEIRPSFYGGGVAAQEFSFPPLLFRHAGSDETCQQLPPGSPPAFSPDPDDVGEEDEDRAAFLNDPASTSAPQ